MKLYKKCKCTFKQKPEINTICEDEFTFPSKKEMKNCTCKNCKDNFKKQIVGNFLLKGGGDTGESNVASIDISCSRKCGCKFCYVFIKLANNNLLIRESICDYCKKLRNNTIKKSKERLYKSNRISLTKNLSWAKGLLTHINNKTFQKNIEEMINNKKYPQGDTVLKELEKVLKTNYEKIDKLCHQLTYNESLTWKNFSLVEPSK